MPKKTLHTPIFSEKDNILFAQALNVALTKENFQASDFSDVNVKSKNGLTPLHISVLLNDPVLVKRLVDSGADTKAKTKYGDTALKYSFKMGSEKSSRALIEHDLQTKGDAFFKSDFTLYKEKNDGISFGGFFEDQAGEGWLLKKAHYDEPRGVVQEYLAGALYQTLLCDNAPRTEIVLDEANGEFLVGSKLLDNFETLREAFGWKSFSFTYQGKPIENFVKVIASTLFIGDTDPHFGNVGLIDYGNHYEMAKIDHGFVFNYFNKLTLKDFHYEMADRYNIKDFNTFEFDEFYNVISDIAKTDFSVYEKVIDERMEIVESYSDAMQYTNLNARYIYQPEETDLQENITQYKFNILSGLKVRHHDFQEIETYLRLEKAIHDHDLFGLVDVIEEDIFKADSKFYSFYKNESHTVASLMEKDWPGLYNEIFKSQSQINLEAILNLPNTTTEYYSNPILPSLIEEPTFHAPLFVEM